MKKIFFVFVSLFLVIGGAAFFFWPMSNVSVSDISYTSLQQQVSEHKIQVATFAGGCFWCTESDFEKVPGVIAVFSGYSGGAEIDPTYDDVSAGVTGHIESVQVFFDSEDISYRALLDVFWKHIDPTDAGGQFVDRGGQYQSALFYHTPEQLTLAQETKASLEQSGVFQKAIVTPFLSFQSFYLAEDYHQDYYKKNPVRYNFYRSRSGRDQFLESVWDREASLRKQLTPLQYAVTQENGTEPPFDNAYWDHKERGIYVDLISGEALFSSTDKYVSGTGWPSFVKPLVADNILEKEDKKLFVTRTEVRSKKGDAHLGHLFPDGPEDRGGLRYCVNSAALRFVPQDRLVEEGYEEFLSLFLER